MNSLSLLSPAKLNLFLHVTGRRGDGYHQLQTVFQLLDYGDTLTFETTDDAAITVTPQIPGVSPADNLIVRAAHLLQEHMLQTTAGIQCGARIELTKRLPLGGGIGGGSSNAATTLLALNWLWQLDLPLTTLAELGLRLGADVPVFIYGRSAWAEGIGEQLEPIALPLRNYLILVPPCQVSTARIFSQQALTRNSRPITIAAFLREGGRNDCEPVVKKLYPEVAFALDWLSQFGPALMTGTGACVFAGFANRADADAIAQQIPAGYRGFVAQGVERSPVHIALEKIKPSE
jgi:4-diphosphocytidyl-2-C-methyl-D-erythritol kinase